MAEKTGIEWADDSANFWWGCVRVGPGCDHCYAETLAERWGHKVWGTDAPRREMPNAFTALAKIQAKAKAEGKRRRVFINSMSDLAEILPEGHPQKERLADIAWRFFIEVEQGAYPDLDLIWLTKRIGNVAKIVPPGWMKWNWPNNLWLLATVVNQKEANRDIPKLMAIPAAVRGLSIEPQLGQIDLTMLEVREGRYINCLTADFHDGEGSILAGPPSGTGSIDWVICGGESGPNARPMHPDWASSLRDQCQAAGVPYFFKQWGEWQEGSARHGNNATILSNGKWCFDDAIDRADWVKENRDDWDSLNAHAVSKVGKKAAGRLLDGRTWDQFPEVRS